jgi:protein-S-isoprenylcysteine O-methyltransferase Ste14
VITFDRATTVKISRIASVSGTILLAVLAIFYWQQPDREADVMAKICVGILVCLFSVFISYWKTDYTERKGHPVALMIGLVIFAVGVVCVGVILFGRALGLI